MTNTTTHHDATVEGHRRVLRATWNNVDDVDLRFGPQIDQPNIDGWREYDGGAHHECTFVVLSPNGD